VLVVNRNSGKRSASSGEDKRERSARTIWWFAILPVTDWNSLKQLREYELRPIAPTLVMLRERVRSDDYAKPQTRGLNDTFKLCLASRVSV